MYLTSHPPNLICKVCTRIGSPHHHNPLVLKHVWLAITVCVHDQPLVPMHRHIRDEGFGIMSVCYYNCIKHLMVLLVLRVLRGLLGLLGLLVLLVLLGMLVLLVLSRV